MRKKINHEFPIQSPVNIYESFSGLAERGLMTPTYLASLFMLVGLPATRMVKKNMPIENDEQGFCKLDSLFKRVNSNFLYTENVFKRYMGELHKFALLYVDGLETVEAKVKAKTDQSQKYEIFFCGNEDDAMSVSLWRAKIQKDKGKNYIFWNYPGVGSSKGSVYSAHDLFKAGYTQARRLIDEGINAQNITLYGYSLGGGVATRVARLLHEEGYLVNLEIDRSFASIAPVIPEKFKDVLGMGHEKSSEGVSELAPLITSTVAMAISGVALGTTFAGFVSSLGFVAATSAAAIGYLGAGYLQAIGFLLQEIMTFIGAVLACPVSICSKWIGDHIKTLFTNIGYCFAYPFNLVAFAINATFSTLSSFIDNVVNIVGSIVGGAIALGGLVAGIFSGLVLGLILSLQLLWTKKPFVMPMTPAFSAVLYSLCCEMNSVYEMRRLLKVDHNDEEPKISVLNTLDDEVIRVNASLSKGLGFVPKNTNQDQRFGKKIDCAWYECGGHNGELKEVYRLK